MRTNRRAYEKDGTEIPPMTLGHLRHDSGIRNVEIECCSCKHEASLNVDMLPDDVPVPDVAIILTRLKCSRCGARGEALYVRPDWRQMNAAGMGKC